MKNNKYIKPTIEFLKIVGSDIIIASGCSPEIQPEPTPCIEIQSSNDITLF